MLITNNITEEVMATVQPVLRDRPPTHPGALIRSHLKDLGISMREAQRGMGIKSPSTLADILDERARITVDIAQRLGAFFGNGPELWINMQVAYDLYHTGRTMKRELADIRKNSIALTKEALE